MPSPAPTALVSSIQSDSIGSDRSSTLTVTGIALHPVSPSLQLMMPEKAT